MKTPYDILDYVMEKNLESDFLTAIALHKANCSIGEIPDKRYKQTDGKWKLISKSYSLNIEISDPEISAALSNGLYVTPFIMRKENERQLHFLVHRYPENKKPDYEDEIAREVVNYMILRVIIGLRLDTEEKVSAYLKF